MAKRIILTIYFLSGFGLWTYELLTTSCNDWGAMFHSCIIERIFITPLIIFMLLGIPTKILLIIWKDKKARVN